jgi:ribosomal 50S subunit-associated protein YjgA (DUF615 family)
MRTQEMNMNYPELIEQTSLGLAEKARTVAELRERLAEIEAIETLAIANAKTSEGKPQFSNEATRSAELVLRLGRNDDVVAIKRTLAQLEGERAKSSARVERMRGEFKIALLERQAEIATMNAPHLP